MNRGTRQAVALRRSGHGYAGRHVRAGRVFVPAMIMVVLGGAAGAVDAFYFRPIKLDRQGASVDEVIAAARDRKARAEAETAELTRDRDRTTTAMAADQQLTPEPSTPSGTDAGKAQPSPAKPSEASTAPSAAPPADRQFAFTPESQLAKGQVSVAKAWELFGIGAKFIDTRKPEEYEAGHVEGAMRMGLSAFKSGDPPLLSMILRSEPVVVYCNGGTCDESEHVARNIEGAGYKSVFVLRDGFPGWKAAGHPVQTGEGLQEGGQ